MKFLCAVYLEPGALAVLSQKELAELDRASVDYDQGLATSGHYLASSPLQPVGTAKTVRHRKGKVVVTDGPFAETKEVLGGFLFIEAADMEEALRIAENVPVGKFGSIEVRPELKIG